jgi:hypothetical protein
MRSFSRKDNFNFNFNLTTSDEQSTRNLLINKYHQKEEHFKVKEFEDGRLGVECIPCGMTIKSINHTVLDKHFSSEKHEKSLRSNDKVKQVTDIISELGHDLESIRFNKEHTYWACGLCDETKPGRTIGPNGSFVRKHFNSKHNFLQSLLPPRKSPPPPSVVIFSSSSDEDEDEESSSSDENEEFPPTVSSEEKPPALPPKKEEEEPKKISPSPPPQKRDREEEEEGENESFDDYFQKLLDERLEKEANKKMKDETYIESLITENCGIFDELFQETQKKQIDQYLAKSYIKIQKKLI